MNKIKCMEVDAERVKKWLNTKHDNSDDKYTQTKVFRIVRVGDESWHKSYERTLATVSGELSGYYPYYVLDVSIIDSYSGEIHVKFRSSGRW